MSRELVSDTPVRPRAKLHVTPDDFPFRDRTIEHHEGDTPTGVALRHALRPARRRASGRERRASDRR
jgi:hypothetical protein